MIMNPILIETVKLYTLVNIRFTLIEIWIGGYCLTAAISHKA
jgi:hypothetical protein